MWPNSVTKVEIGRCASDYLLPNHAITDMMKQFLKSIDTKQGREFRPRYSHFEENASLNNDNIVLAQKEKLMNEKALEARKDDTKQVDLAILSSDSNTIKPKVIPRKRKIEDHVHIPVSNAFELTPELRLQIDRMAKREVDKLVKQNYVAVPNDDKNAKKKRKLSK